jgi:hypothetical protein
MPAAAGGRRPERRTTRTASGAAVEVDGQPSPALKGGSYAICPADGRFRRSPTIPRDHAGCHAGTAPRNKGQRYPADPPTVEEYHRWRGEADARELERVDHISAFVTSEPVSGVYEVIDTLEQ